MKKFAFALAALCAGVSLYAQNDEVQYNQYGVKVDVDPLVAEAQDGILVLRSKNSGYKIWLDNRVQVDGAYFFGEPDYAEEIGSGVSIRRARFAVKGQIDSKWYGEVDMDMADGCFELKDAIIRYDGIKNMHIQAGNFKEFFSIQRNNSSRYLMFMERPMIANALAPSRHIGVNALYYDKGLWLSGGLFFSECKGSEERTYVEENNKSYGQDDGISATVKAIYMPGWNKTDWGMHIAGAFSYRTPKMSGESLNNNRFSTRNTTSINRKKYLDTDIFGPVDHDLLYTAELAGYWKGLRYEAVYMADDSFLKAGGSKHFGGWYAQASYLLFGGRQRYDNAGAKFTRVQRGKDWGDIEVCARIENIDLNADRALPLADQKLMGGSAMAYSFGVNYYVNDHVKFVVNYQYNDQDRYASGKGNKFTVGYNKSGIPTQDPKRVASAQQGVDYSMVSFRMEIDF